MSSFPDSPFLMACRRQPVTRTPLWLMRQAGRYMAEYRALRKKYDMLTLCRTPELAAEVTLQPIRAFGMDAAILFTDLLIPLPPMGLDLEFAKGEGPVIHNPISSPKDVKKLKLVEPEQAFPYMLESIRILKKELKVPLIAFAGAPFTLASYMIEGGHSRNFEKTKKFMWEQPAAWNMLMEKVARVANRTLKAQVEVGANAVQLFDSWVGALGPEDYRQHVLPWSREALSGIDVPKIHFGTGSGTFLELMHQAGGDVIGLDWRTPLSDGFKRLPGAAIMGNLDPVALMAPAKELRRRVRAILDEVGGRRGFIFNLGHGILPGTPVSSVRLVVDEVHAYKIPR